MADKYTVHMTRTKVETAEIEVDAADDKDAERKAKEQADSDRTIWSLDDEDIEITDVIKEGSSEDEDESGEEE